MNVHEEASVKPLDPSAFPLAAEVVRASFATVAKSLGITQQNCPGYTGFTTTAEKMQTHRSWGWLMYGLYERERLVGYVSISKQADGAYEIHNLAVLPECRHRGYGRRLLDCCMAKVKEMGGGKVSIGIVEENTVLKNWYADYGFSHQGIKKYDHLPFICGFMELEV